MSRPGFTLTEHNKMLLSNETRSGLRLTGQTLWYSSHNIATDHHFPYSSILC